MGGTEIACEEVDCMPCSLGQLGLGFKEWGGEEMREGVQRGGAMVGRDDPSSPPLVGPPCRAATLEAGNGRRQAAE